MEREEGGEALSGEDPFSLVVAGYQARDFFFFQVKKRMWMFWWNGNDSESTLLRKVFFDKVFFYKPR